MGLYNHIFGQKQGYGKLFAKTSSTAVNWELRIIGATVFNYTIIDNNTASIIAQGQSTLNGIFEDLSSSSGDASIYVEVDEFGNNANYLYLRWSIPKLTWINLAIFPLINRLNIANGEICHFENPLSNLIDDVYFFGGTFTGLDFSQTTEITSFVLRYILTTDIPINIQGNTNLIFLILWYKAYPSIQEGVFTKLKSLQFVNPNTGVLNPLINNVNMPDLRTLVTYYGYQIDLDLTTQNLSLLTLFRANIDNLVGINQLDNVVELWIKNLISSEGTTTLDLTALTTLTKFHATFQYWQVNKILLDNGLNNQMITVSRDYSSTLMDLQVDNPTDANNGVAPYDTGWTGWNYI